MHQRRAAWEQQTYTAGERNNARRPWHYCARSNHTFSLRDQIFSQKSKKTFDTGKAVKYGNSCLFLLFYLTVRM
jgi:hypothetical protein